MDDLDWDWFNSRRCISNEDGESVKKTKLPEHWPYASPQQQIEGLKAVAKYVSIWQFERALTNLVSVKMISKSFKWKSIKRFRKIIGMSFKEYQEGRKHELNRNESSTGGDSGASERGPFGGGSDRWGGWF